MMKKNIPAILAAILLSTGLFSCSSKASDSADSGRLSGSINMSGAFALYPLANVWAQEFSKEYPDVRFNISAGGAGKGMADVLGGATTLGLFSRDFTQSEIDQGIWWVAVTIDAVLPTISAKNPLLGRLKKEGLTQQEFNKIFISSDQPQWKDSGQPVSVYTRSDAAGAAGTWAQYVGGAGQEDLKGIAVYGDPGLAEAVKNDPQAIGFNNVIYIYNLDTGEKYPGLEVVPIDVNENGQIDPEEDFYDNIQEITAAIAAGNYPKPPARELYLISRGKPTDRATLTFLEWVLTKGQQFVEDNGYIVLPQSIVEQQKEKL